MTVHSETKWSDGRNFPEIRAERRDGNIIELDLFVGSNLFQFQGHFPNEPVLPGVAQIDWAARLGQQHFGINGPIARLGQLKFSRLVGADSLLHLRLEWNNEKQRLLFSYREGDETCSSGYFELSTQ